MLFSAVDVADDGICAAVVYYVAVDASIPAVADVVAAAVAASAFPAVTLAALSASDYDNYDGDDDDDIVTVVASCTASGHTMGNRMTSPTRGMTCKPTEIP